MTHQNQQHISSPLVRARVLWYLECWGLKRIDAWGASYIVSALVLISHHALTVKTCLLLAAITANYWLGFWLNDYFDAPYDRNDARKALSNLFVQRPAANRQVWKITSLILTLSVALFSSFGARGVIVLLVSFAIMWAYSAPPFRLKSRPGLDLLTHALFVLTWPYLICMWLIGATWTELDGILLAVCFLASLNAQLNQQVRDFEVDSRTDTNFATRVGLTKTILVLKASTVLLVAIVLLAIFSGRAPWLFIPLWLASLPILAHQLLHTLQNSSRIFSRRFVYIIMPLLLIYMGCLIVIEQIA